MRADADDAPAVHHDDAVGVHDRAHALGDDDHGRLGGLALERGAQPRVGLEVERREAVVEDVDLGPLHERAGDGESLALAAGDVRAALRDRRLETLGHLGDELLALRDFERVPELVVGRVLLAVAQVARDGAAEQERLLRDEADLAPEVVAVHVADVDAVDEHRAAGHVVEAGDEVDERRLAAARAADDRRGLARRGRERHAAQHGVLGARVAELDVAELDVAALAGLLEPGMSGSLTEGSVSSTSWMRVAEAAARGTMTNMRTAIITDMRICMM